MENDKNQQQLGTSNAERDQDEGSMNNGTIGGDISIDTNNNDKDKKNNSVDVNDGSEASEPD